MKNLIFFLVFMVSAFVVSAQSTAPRFGITPNADNTGRVLTWKYQSIADATGADSAILVPSAYNTTVRVTLTDSFTLKQPNIKQSYAADIIRVVVSGASGTKLKFSGTNYQTAGTATLSTGGRAVITLIFDGVKWVEASRVVQ
jgi:hypothetical protein